MADPEIRARVLSYAQMAAEMAGKGAAAPARGKGRWRRDWPEFASREKSLGV